MRLPAVPGPRDLVQLVERVTGLLGTAERLLSDAGTLLTSATDLIARIEETRQEAGVLVARTEETRAGAEVLLDRFRPVLEQLLPTLERLAETTDPAEVDALVGLVDHLPLLVSELETSVIPVLQSLSSVAPDLHDLLDTSRELNLVLARLPGMGRIRNRVDERRAADES